MSLPCTSNANSPTATFELLKDLIPPIFPDVLVLLKSIPAKAFPSLTVISASPATPCVPAPTIKVPLLVIAPLDIVPILVRFFEESITVLLPIFNEPTLTLANPLSVWL